MKDTWSVADSPEKQTFICHITETTTTKSSNRIFWDLGFIQTMLRNMRFKLKWAKICNPNISLYHLTSINKPTLKSINQYSYNCSHAGRTTRPFTIPSFLGHPPRNVTTVFAIQATQQLQYICCAHHVLPLLWILLWKSDAQQITLKACSVLLPLKHMHQEGCLSMLSKLQCWVFSIGW